MNEKYDAKGAKIVKEICDFHQKVSKAYGVMIDCRLTLKFKDKK